MAHDNSYDNQLSAIRILLALTAAILLVALVWAQFVVVPTIDHLDKKVSEMHEIAWNQAQGKALWWVPTDSLRIFVDPEDDLECADIKIFGIECPLGTKWVYPTRSGDEMRRRRNRLLVRQNLGGWHVGSLGPLCWAFCGRTNDGSGVLGLSWGVTKHLKIMWRRNDFLEEKNERNEHDD
jgi:hypothetical protein